MMRKKATALKKAAQALFDSDLVLGGSPVLGKPQIDSLGEAWEVVEPHTRSPVCPSPGDEPPVAVLSDELLDEYQRLLSG